MDSGEKVALAGLAIAGVAIGVAWFGGTAHAATNEPGAEPGGPGVPSPNEQALQPGFFDADAVLAGLAGTPEHPAPQPPAAQALCTIRTLSENHLRPTATAVASGPVYPRETSVEVLARTGITSRNGSALYHVRIVQDGAQGYFFLSSAETASCPQE